MTFTQIAETSVNIGAVGVIIYLASWVFLTLRDDCRRKNKMNPTAQKGCIACSAFLSVVVMVFLVVAVVI